MFDYVYQYKDHLGNIRMSYGLDDMDEELKVIEEHHYYPFGLKHTKYNSGSKKYEGDEVQIGKMALKPVEPGGDVMNKYMYNGKEWQDELGLGWYDYQARNYDPAIGRWMNIDPLAEKGYNWTPYRYAYDNPLMFKDPDGMLEDDYGIDDAGNISLIKQTDDKFDRLYKVDEKNNKQDTDGNNKINKNDSVKVGKGILNQFEKSKEIIKTDDNDLSLSSKSTSKANTANNADYKKLFKFISDNTPIEFSLTFYNDKGMGKVTLSTLHDTGETHSPFTLGISNPNKNVLLHIHSHPDIRVEKVSENYSMGGDYERAVQRKATYSNQVYFPESSRLYNVTKEGIQYVKNINSSQDFKK